MREFIILLKLCTKVCICVCALHVFFFSVYSVQSFYGAPKGPRWFCTIPEVRCWVEGVTLKRNTDRPHLAQGKASWLGQLAQRARVFSVAQNKSLFPSRAQGMCHLSQAQPHKIMIPPRAFFSGSALIFSGWQPVCALNPLRQHCSAMEKSWGIMVVLVEPACVMWVFRRRDTDRYSCFTNSLSAHPFRKRKRLGPHHTKLVSTRPRDECLTHIKGHFFLLFSLASPV